MSDAVGRQRVAIEEVTPEIDGGRFPIQRVVGETVAVTAAVFADGPDVITCRLLYRSERATGWRGVAMQPLENDVWRGEITVDEPGRWQYTVTAWVDPFKTWRREIEQRAAAGMDIKPELRIGAALVRDAVRRAEAEGKQPAARILAGLAQNLEADTDPAARLRLALDEELTFLMERQADRSLATTHPILKVAVDGERARFSSWYEAGPADRRGTFQDAAALLPTIAKMGFDVLSLRAGLPDLSESFQLLREKAEGLGCEIALDLAELAGPDRELDPARWQQLKSGIDRWIAAGVRIFRSASPDDRPFPFWEWLIREVKSTHPDVLFIAGAVARPRVAHRLAKLGFARTHADLPALLARRELTEAFTALRQTADFFRPQWTVSLPEGLDEPLPPERRPAFLQRFLLAATLGAGYSLYAPLSDGDPAGQDSLRELIGLVNKIRRDNPALQTDRGLRFHPTDNEQILCFSKVDDKQENTILVVVNLDPQYTQSAWVELPVGDLGLATDQPYQVHDLLTGARYLWHGSRNFVQLDPSSIPAHIFRVRRRARSERDSFSR
jgi:starch synthase (maltosyl-transferring)